MTCLYSQDFFRIMLLLTDSTFVSDFFIHEAKFCDQSFECFDQIDQIIGGYFCMLFM